MQAFLDLRQCGRRLFELHTIGPQLARRGMPGNAELHALLLDFGTPVKVASTVPTSM